MHLVLVELVGHKDGSVEIVGDNVIKSLRRQGQYWENNKERKRQIASRQTV